MKERPILFSAPMIRAILEGRKTQTRRVMRVDNHPAVVDWVIDSEGRAAARAINDKVLDQYVTTFPHGRVPCRYGRVGDRLWVRETWVHYQTVNSVRRQSGASFSEISDGLAGYRADGHETIEDFRKHVQLMSGCDLEAVEINGDRWRPSIHMPRWASRIDLKVTGVRVERLNDISETDARAEGAMYHDGRGIGHSGWRHDFKEVHRDARNSFARLWNDINGENAWLLNPWVWAIEFKRINS